LGLFCPTVAGEGTFDPRRRMLAHGDPLPLKTEKDNSASVAPR
jgi:hypothetical protein